MDEKLLEEEVLNLGQKKFSCEEIGSKMISIKSSHTKEVQISFNEKLNYNEGSNPWLINQISFLLSSFFFKKYFLIPLKFILQIFYVKIPQHF